MTSSQNPTDKMRTETHVFGFLFFTTLVSLVFSNWWSASIHLVLKPEKICEKRRRVHKNQAKVCRYEPQIINEIVKGVQLGKNQCQAQFENNRWNCSTAKRSLRRVLRKDTKEAGYVNAITAAGVITSITQGCSLGNILTCTCKRQKIKRETPLIENGVIIQHEWSGCSDNIDFGYERTKEFMDSRWRKRSHDIKTKILLHNYEAGRLAVKNYMTRHCQCHGLTGSCSIRTCWDKIPSMKQVGAHLKRQYRNSVEVMSGNDGNSFVRTKEMARPPSDENLVYSEKSPDYCNFNRKFGSLGTRGRLCKLNSDRHDSCKHLCCDRGFVTRTRKITETCKCVFHWCCEVKCQSCQRKVIYSTCL